MSQAISPGPGSIRAYVRGSAKIGVNALLFTVSAFAAFLLRFDFSLSQAEVDHILFALPVWLIVKSWAFKVFHLDRSTWRFISAPDAIRLVSANVTSSVISAPIIAVFGLPGFPRSIYLLDLALSLLLTGGVRLAGRIFLERRNGKKHPDCERAFIYGAGAAGAMLLREILCNQVMGYKVCGFIDDDSSKIGMMIHGIPVVGSGAALAKLAPQAQVTVVLIAIRSTTRHEMLKVLNNSAAANLRFRTVPSLAEMMQRNGSGTQIRDVAPEDLLGRTPVRLDEDNVKAKLEDQIVLVTGAAGSIGSELCRQVARFRPKSIIGFDISETALFNLDREMRRTFPDVSFQPTIGSIQDTAGLTRAFGQHRPAVVFHAAAYKHVPLMESHVFEAIQNNVLGTFSVFQAAERAGVQDFVMISTDKAVRPTSIMGLTKRVAEIVLGSMQHTCTKHASVRFGNVLGSGGSAVPIFQEQIAAGRPITVTHPEMRRYFMTIPEAVQLVLQAFTMGRGGEIFVLDMGEPVRIVDLARNLILLSGLRPDQDIKIEFTGIRPGEKLYEELSTLDEQTRPTYHEKIRIFGANGACITDVHAWAADVRDMCACRDLRVILMFKELVSDYNPSTQIMRTLFGQGALAMGAAAAATYSQTDARVTLSN